MDKISISRGNIKMGAIPSVSLPPVTTCPAGCPCAKLCYATKLCKLRPTVAAAYSRNLNAYTEDPDGYFRQVSAAMCTTRFFRFHVSGDCPDPEYMSRVFQVCRDNPGTRVLMFTKRYEWAAAEIDRSGKPDNLQIVLSEWGTLPVYNPHNLPTAAVIFKGHNPDPRWKICGGNCTECASCGIGCWELHPGETIAFYQH